MHLPLHSCVVYRYNHGQESSRYLGKATYSRLSVLLLYGALFCHIRWFHNYFASVNRRTLIRSRGCTGWSGKLSLTSCATKTPHIKHDLSCVFFLHIHVKAAIILSDAGTIMSKINMSNSHNNAKWHEQSSGWYTRIQKFIACTFLHIHAFLRCWPPLFVYRGSHIFS